MLKVGDFVFIQACRRSTRRKEPEIKFKGFGLAVFLTALGPFQREPVQGDALVLMGRAGFLNFDDVGEFLGPEAQKISVEKFATKYYGFLKEPAEAPKELLDVSGQKVGHALVPKPVLVDPTSEKPSVSPLYKAINESVARDKNETSERSQTAETLKSLANDPSLTESIPRSVATSMAQELLKRRVAEKLFREIAMTAVIALINRGDNGTILDFERRALEAEKAS